MDTLFIGDTGTQIILDCGIYAILWSLYMALAAERDAATVEGD